MAICTPSAAISLICRQMPDTISGEILSPLPEALSASPLNLRTMRRYFGFATARDFERVGAFGIVRGVNTKACELGKGKSKAEEEVASIQQSVGSRRSAHLTTDYILPRNSSSYGPIVTGVPTETLLKNASAINPGIRMQP